MNVLPKNARRWWLPTLILLLAILSLSLLLPGLIYPQEVNPGNRGPFTLRTRTPTATAALTAPPATQPALSLDIIEQVTPRASSRENCTYTLYYWRDHPQAWLAENILIGRLSYTKAEALAILQVESTDTATILLKQFFAALLNTLKGADASAIEPDLIAASDWLGAHAPGAAMAEEERQRGAGLASALEGYNSGALGPGHCPDEPPTPTPLPSATPSPTPTRRPARTPTRRPATATEAGKPDKGTQETPLPTETPAATPAAPTDTPAPSQPPPSDTPAPSETPARATPTEAPTEAPTSTPPPAPTEATPETPTTAPGAGAAAEFPAG